MAITNEMFNTIKMIIQQELSKATSLQSAMDGISKGVTQYIGARYVPLFANPINWNKDLAYEALTIVLYQGNSYTSRQAVPEGIDISNEAFWAETGNYNAQVEQYRQDVAKLSDHVTAIDATLNDTVVKFPAETVKSAYDLGMSNDGKTDNTPILKKAIEDHPNGLTILFSGGVYRFSPMEIGTDGINLIGCNAAPIIPGFGSSMRTDVITSQTACTVFAPVGNQDYVLKYNQAERCTIENVTFTTVGIRPSYSSVESDLDSVKTALYLNNVRGCVFKYVNFIDIKGRGILIADCWESNFEAMQFRFMVPSDMLPTECGAIEFEKSGYINSSALNFNNLNMERLIMHYIYNNGARLQNILVSDFACEINSLDGTSYTSSDLQPNVNPKYEMDSTLCIIAANNSAERTEINISNLSIDNFGLTQYQKNSYKYSHYGIFGTRDDSGFSVTVGTLVLSRTYAGRCYYYGTDETEGKYKSVAIGSINTGILTGPEMQIMKGTLNRLSIEPPFIVNTPALLYFPQITKFAPVVSNHRLFTESKRTITEVCRLTNSDKSCLSIALAAGRKVTLFAEKGANIEVKAVYGIDENLDVVASKTELTSYDLYSVTATLNTSYLSVKSTDSGNYVIYAVFV